MTASRGAHLIRATFGVMEGIVRQLGPGQSSSLVCTLRPLPPSSHAGEASVKQKWMAWARATDDRGTYAGAGVDPSYIDGTLKSE